MFKAPNRTRLIQIFFCRRVFSFRWSSSLAPASWWQGVVQTNKISPQLYMHYNLALRTTYIQSLKISLRSARLNFVGPAACGVQRCKWAELRIRFHSLRSVLLKAMKYRLSRSPSAKFLFRSWLQLNTFSKKGYYNFWVQSVSLCFRKIIYAFVGLNHYCVFSQQFVFLCYVLSSKKIIVFSRSFNHDVNSFLQILFGWGNVLFPLCVRAWCTTRLSKQKETVSHYATYQNSIWNETQVPTVV